MDGSLVHLNKNQYQNYALTEKVVFEESPIPASKQNGEDHPNGDFLTAIKKNAPHGPYGFDLFLRELFYFNDFCPALVESAAELFGEKYPKNLALILTLYSRSFE